MGRFVMALFAALLVSGLGIQDAEAKRLGGGMSRGMQRDSVTQRQAAPPPASPTQQQAGPAQPSTPTSAMPQTPQKRSWLGPIAGLAAGLGLAALFSHLGLGEELAGIVMLLLLAGVAVVAVRWLLRSRATRDALRAMQFAGAAGPLAGTERANAIQRDAFAVPRPARAGGSTAAIPPGFDTEGFVRVAKVNFLRLQAANDRADLDDIREFTTPEMFAEIKLDIDERRGASQHTDVLDLEAELLEATTERDRHVASVRFHGSIREEGSARAEPFDEVWNLIKPVDGSRGWQVAGIQQLH